MSKWFAPLCAALVLAAPAANACGAGSRARFMIQGADVFDKKSGLVWQRCGIGLQFAPSGRCVGQKATLDFVGAIDAARAAGAGWRVPTIAELASLLDESCDTPAIDTAIFPDVSANEGEESAYWTQSEVGAADLVYYVDFLSGTVDGHSKGFSLAVRLVKSSR